MTDSQRPRAGDLQVAPGDTTITPWDGGFLIGQISEDGRWHALDTAATLAAALRLVQEQAQPEGRVLVSRDGGTFELFEPTRLWLEPERDWQSYDRRSVERRVPPAPGVYMIRTTTPVLVGDTENLRDRLLYHLDALPACPQAKAGQLKFCFEVLDNARARSERATHLIAWWSPPCNQHA